MVEVEVQLLFRVGGCVVGGWMVGGWSDKTKLILISTLVEVEVEVELGSNEVNRKKYVEVTYTYQLC